MLAKINRLLKEKDINKVFRRGKSYNCKGIRASSLKTDLTQSRFCIIISSRISKKAIKRNKIKRQIREIIKSMLNKINNNYDIIFIVNSSAILDKKYGEIRELIISSLRGLKIYRQ